MAGRMNGIAEHTRILLTRVGKINSLVDASMAMTLSISKQKNGKRGD